MIFDSLRVVNNNILGEDKKSEVDNHKPHRGRRRDDLRYRLFAEAYLNIADPTTYLNAMQSALRAGYKESYAKHHSYKLVDQRGVQDWMKRIRDDRLKHSTIATPEEVLETLTAILRTLPNELVNDNGNLIPLNQLTRDQAQMITGYKHRQRTFDTEDGPVTEDTIEYKLADRLKAAEMIGRHHGIFEKDNRQKPSGENTRLVAYPLGELSLEEWQAQVVVIMAGTERAGKRPAPPELPDPAGTSTGT